MSKLVIAFVVSLAVLATACSPTVVSRDSGQTIAQAQQQPMDGPKRRIAVTAFEMKAGRGSASVGKGMSDMLTDALVNSGRFIVLERENVKDVLGEQDFGRSGRVRRESAPAVGEIEGAQLLIRGSVIQFEPECSGGTLAIVGMKQACVAIAMRIIDAKTGQVLNSTTVDGSAVTAGAGLTLNLPYTPLPVGLGGWSKTPMEKAIRNCIDSAVQHIVKTKL
jgi:curli biogenesis system outer membrane secretion channel CsgG